MKLIKVKAGFVINSVIVFCILLTSGGQVSAKDKFQFKFQPNPQDQLQKITETPQIRIAQQYGLGYLPLMVMRQHRLIEKHARLAGLGDVRINWMKFPNGEKMNQSLETGFLDIASGGLVPMISAWDKTRFSAKAKGLAALSRMPMYLTSRNIEIKNIRDYTDTHRILLPAPKTSAQAVTLQMAVAKVYGQAQFAKLDAITQGMSHPDAVDKMISKDSKVTSHFTSPPFQYQELDHPGIHKVLSSYDVLGGPATFTVLWASQSFIDNNPHTGKAIYSALLEAIAIIQKDSGGAASTYVQQANSSLSEDYVHEILSRSENSFNTKPLNIMKIADFMYKTGKISKPPAEWQELFFDYVQEY